MKPVMTILLAAIVLSACKHSPNITPATTSADTVVHPKPADSFIRFKGLQKDIYIGMNEDILLNFTAQRDSGKNEIVKLTIEGLPALMSAQLSVDSGMLPLTGSVKLTTNFSPVISPVQISFIATTASGVKHTHKVSLRVTGTDEDARRIFAKKYEYAVNKKYYKYDPHSRDPWFPFYTAPFYIIYNSKTGNLSLPQLLLSEDTSGFYFAPGYSATEADWLVSGGTNHNKGVIQFPKKTIVGTNDAGTTKTFEVSAVANYIYSKNMFQIKYTVDGFDRYIRGIFVY